MSLEPLLWLLLIDLTLHEKAGPSPKSSHVPDPAFTHAAGTNTGNPRAAHRVRISARQDQALLHREIELEVSLPETADGQANEVLFGGNKSRGRVVLWSRCRIGDSGCWIHAFTHRSGCCMSSGG